METEQKHHLTLPLAGASVANTTVKQGKILTKRPVDGSRAEKITVMDLDPKELAFVFAFEPHPVTFA